ncbi:hypothetical protein ILYODFUR_019992 [Ilyodon furcidens]|uniref:Uncharacterized protein n=1 Tax=Ilyodon furcidens TaxID=33524 RepID=A0ABV0SZN0_9TELE
MPTLNVIKINLYYRVFVLFDWTESIALVLQYMHLGFSTEYYNQTNLVLDYLCVNRRDLQHLNIGDSDSESISPTCIHHEQLHKQHAYIVHRLHVTKLDAVRQRPRKPELILFSQQKR